MKRHRHEEGPVRRRLGQRPPPVLSFPLAQQRRELLLEGGQARLRWRHGFVRPRSHGLQGAWRAAQRPVSSDAGPRGRDVNIYWMTSSARAATDWGIATRDTFAVLTSITSRNVSGRALLGS